MSNMLTVLSWPEEELTCLARDKVTGSNLSTPAADVSLAFAMPVRLCWEITILVNLGQFAADCTM